MDLDRFDRWTRFVARRATRRTAVGLGLAGLAAVLTGHESRAAPCHRPNVRCGKGAIPSAVPRRARPTAVARRRTPRALPMATPGSRPSSATAGRATARRRLIGDNPSAWPVGSAPTLRARRTPIVPTPETPAWSTAPASAEAARPARLRARRSRAMSGRARWTCRGRLGERALPSGMVRSAGVV